MVKNTANRGKIRALACAVIQTELEAIETLLGRIDENFSKACELLMDCQGRVVVTGMGKSGHIANKIASTLASTGTPAFFIHPGEASHGDLGMITPQDVIIAISNSGETTEVINILPVIKLLGTPLISMTGNPNSTLAKHASVNLDIHTEKEACPLNLAPTASTTVTLVLGDALAISLLQLKDFTAKDFARSHPSGSLGKRLLLRASDLMHSGDELPLVNETATVKEALIEMTRKGFGSTLVLNKDGQMIGVYTDGDVRRTLDKNTDIHTTKISDIIKKNAFKFISADTLAAEALHIMEKHKITMLVILDDNKKPLGLVHIHDILRSGLL